MSIRKKGKQMRYGDIFRDRVKADLTHLNLIEIENKAIKRASFKRYGKNLVNNRGNIFKNKNQNIDKLFDKKIASL